MKKKFIATLLLLTSITYNAYAASVSSIKQVVSIIDYSFIDKLIIERNTTVKTNQNIVDKLFINYNSLSNAEDDIEDAIEEMKSLLSTYNVQSSTPTIPVVSEDISLDDPVIEDIYSNINKLMLSFQAMNNMNIESLRNNINTMEDQLDNINTQQADMASQINKMKLQTEMVNNQMIWTGENLIFAYNSINTEEKKICEKLDLLQNQLNALNVQKDLGYAIIIDAEGLELNIEDLRYTEEALNLQKQNIERQLNLLLGQSYDTSLDIVFNSTINISKLNSMDKTDNVESALERNYTINLQAYELQAKKVALARAEHDHGKYSNEYRLAGEELEDVELNFEDTKRTQKLKFQQLYEVVKDKQKLAALEDKKLAQEKNKVEAAKKKYDLGVISKLEYDDIKSSYNLQLFKVETVKGDLFAAYRKYEWMLKGLGV